MTAAWIVQRPNEEPLAFDDQDSAKRAVANLTHEQQRAACIFAVEVEPEVRGRDYWERKEGAA